MDSPERRPRRGAPRLRATRRRAPDAPRQSLQARSFRILSASARAASLAVVDASARRTRRLAAPPARVALRAAPRTTVGAPSSVDVDSRAGPSGIAAFLGISMPSAPRGSSAVATRAAPGWAVGCPAQRASGGGRTSCARAAGRVRHDRKARCFTCARRHPEIYWPAGGTGGWMTPAPTCAESGYPAARPGAGNDLARSSIGLDTTRWPARRPTNNLLVVHSVFGAVRTAVRGRQDRRPCGV